MTKKEMAAEILSHTTLSWVSEREFYRKVARCKKERMVRIYEAFIGDKEHANFYWCLL